MDEIETIRPRRWRLRWSLAGLMALVAVVTVLILMLVPQRERDAVAYAIRMAELAYPESRPRVISTEWIANSRIWAIQLVDEGHRVAHCEVGSGFLWRSFSISYEAPPTQIPGPATPTGPGDEL